MGFFSSLILFGASGPPCVLISAEHIYLPAAHDCSLDAGAPTAPLMAVFSCSTITEREQPGQSEEAASATVPSGSSPSRNFSACATVELLSDVSDVTCVVTAFFCVRPSGQEQSGSGEACDNFTDLDLSHCFIGTSLYVRLLLYTRSNLDCGRELRHQRPSEQPLFNASRPTAFVIHGYRPTGAPPIWINHIVHLLAKQDDMNIIVVDWNKGAANLNYFTAVTYTRQAAHNLTGFILAMQVSSVSGKHSRRVPARTLTRCVCRRRERLSARSTWWASVWELTWPDSSEPI